ncbi:unnamed protein product [Meloidogyne enterolobii]|uniref:Uncharacterized protein n=1 Tax=Meloidogyne enterolobii TaxID=390850 RepID=A0ACB1B6P4_MELEN
MTDNSEVKNEKMVQPEYVIVAKSLDEEAERIELPADQDGSLGIQTLAGAFPGAHGLKYKNPATGAFRALLIDPAGTKFFPPADGWENKVFIVICKQQDPAPEKVQPKKGDQNAKRRKLMVESDDGDSHDSDSDRPPGEKLRNKSSGGGGETVKRQIGVSKQKRMMGSVDNGSSGGGGLINKYDNYPVEYVDEMCEEEQNVLNFPNRMVDLLVLGLPFELTEEELKKHFETFGKVVHCEVKIQKGSNTNRGFGFVQMNDLESQRKVLQQKTHYIGGRACQVKVPFTKNALSSKVFVGRIKEGTTTMDLREFFAEEARKIEPDSTITDVYIPRPFRSFAFVSFSSPIVAKELIKVGQFTMGENQIYVSSAHSTRPPNTTQQQQLVDNSLSSYQHPFKPNAQNFFTDWYGSHAGGAHGGDLTGTPSLASQIVSSANLPLYPSHASMFTQAYQQQPVFIGSQNAPPHSHPPPGVAPGNQMLNQLETLNLNNMGIGHEVVNAIKAIFSVAQQQNSPVSQHSQYAGHQQHKLAGSISPPPVNPIQSNSSGRYIPPRERPTRRGNENNGSVGSGGGGGGSIGSGGGSGWR